MAREKAGILPKEEIAEQFLTQQCKMYSFFFFKKTQCSEFLIYNFCKEKATHTCICISMCMCSEL